MEINDYIESLKLDGNSLLQTVSKVKRLMHCDLSESVKLVLNSPSWSDHKEYFMRQQDELWTMIKEEADETGTHLHGEKFYTFKVNNIKNQEEH